MYCYQEIGRYKYAYVWLNIDACGINEGNIDVMIELDLSNLKSLYLGMIWFIEIIINWIKKWERYVRNNAIIKQTELFFIVI